MSAEIQVIRLLNPFNPHERAYETLEWVSGKSLAEYFPPAVAAPVVVSINGRIVQPEEFAETFLSPDDNLVICPIPTKGGGKNIFRTVALIALSVAAPGIGNAIAASTMGVAGTTFLAGTSMTMGSLFGMAINMAGGMLINSVFATSPTKPAGSNFATQDLNSSRSYGIDGAKNASAEGIPVPVCYGTFRMAGNVIGLHVDNVGDTQFLYMLLNAGEGPVAAIDGIEINDAPISSFRNAQYQVRLGGSTQEPIDWFNKVKTPVSQGIALTTNWTAEYTTSTAVDELRLDFVAPTGLVSVSTDDGTSSAVSIQVDAEYRKQTGPGTWGVWTKFNDTATVTGETVRYFYYTFTGGDATTPPTITGEVEGSAPTGSQFVQGDSILQSNGFSGGNTTVGYVKRTPITTTNMVISGKTRQPVRKSFAATKLTQGIYQVRVKRITANSTSDYVSDELTLSDIVEIVTDKVSYVNTALVGIKIRLNDQINGIPRVTFMHRGVVIPVFDETTGTWKLANSSNPAWIALDMLTNTRYGGAMSRSRIDVQMFREWASFCDTEGLTFNGPLDTHMTLWDALQHVFRAGRAQIVNVGTRYSVIMERASLPVMMFSVGNMIEGSFKNTWLPMADRANEIEVSYFDKDDKYKQKTMRVYDTAAVASGAPQRSVQITLFGVDNPTRAYKEATLQINMNRLIQQTVEFAAPIEAIACTVGDVIYVQHDMPQWGDAGRFNAGSTTTVMALDRPVTMEVGKTYKALALFDKLSRGTGTVTSAAGAAIVLSKTYASLSGAVKRAVINGKDVAVLSTYNSSGSLGLVVDLAGNTFSAGQAFELWDTDVIVERDVVNSPGTTSSITLQSAMPQAPAQYQHWMFGETGKVKKAFRVKSISGSDDYRRDITAIEYNEAIYAAPGTVPTQVYTGLPEVTNHVTIDGVDEELVLVSQASRSRITVRFHSDQSIYRHSRVYASINGGSLDLIAPDAFGSASVEVNKGDSVKFRVVAISIAGIPAAEATAPETTYVATGKLLPPANLASVTGTGKLFANELKWAWPAGVGFKRVEIRASQTNSFGTAVAVADVAWPATTWTHNGLGVAEQWYYWLRIENTAGDVSGWSTVAVVTSSDTSAISSMISTAVSNDPLVAELSAKVEGVDALAEAVLETTLASDRMFVGQTASDGRIAVAETGLITVINDVSTLAGQYTTLSTTVGDHTTSISSHTTSINGVTGEYMLKIDNNGVMSGFGLRSSLNAGGSVTSKFVVSADWFAIIAPAAAGFSAGDPRSVPFCVLTTTQTINGVVFQPGVYINGGVISNATIDGGAKIIKNSLIGTGYDLYNIAQTTTGTNSIDTNWATYNVTMPSGIASRKPNMLFLIKPNIQTSYTGGIIGYNARVQIYSGATRIAGQSSWGDLNRGIMNTVAAFSGGVENFQEVFFVNQGAISDWNAQISVRVDVVGTKTTGAWDNLCIPGQLENLRIVELGG